MTATRIVRLSASVSVSLETLPRFSLSAATDSEMTVLFLLVFPLDFMLLSYRTQGYSSSKKRKLFRQSDAVLLGQGTAATLGHLSDIAHGVGVTGVFTTSDSFVNDNVALVAHLRETERYMKQNVNEEVGVLELLICSSFSLPAHIHGLVTASAGGPMATARPRFKT